MGSEVDTVVELQPAPSRFDSSGDGFVQTGEYILSTKWLIAAAAVLSLSLAACVDSNQQADLVRNNSVQAMTPGSVPPSKVKIHSLVTQVAKEHGVSPAFAHAVVQVESKYNCHAAHAGAYGIMQVKSQTARGVGVIGNLRDCRTGLEAGMRYLKQAIAQHGEGCAAASAYQRGIRSRSTCTSYGRKIMALTARADYARVASN